MLHFQTAPGLISSCSTMRCLDVSLGRTIGLGDASMGGCRATHSGEVSEVGCATACLGLEVPHEVDRDFIPSTALRITMAEYSGGH